MPNQMIALQTRNPQLPDPASQTAKYANMMNMARQQEAVQRQAAMAQETLNLQKEKGAREEALQPAALATATAGANTAELKYVMDFFNASANDIANAANPEQAVARGARLKQQFPEPALQARIDETIAELVSDPNKFEENRKRILIRTLDAKDQFAVTHKDVFDADGNLILMETSPTGSFPTRVTPGVITNLPNTAGAPAAAPRTPTSSAATGANPFAPDAPAANTAAENVNSLGLVVASARETGVMAQRDVDKLLSAAAPGSAPKLMAWLSQNNIQVVPDAPGVTDNQMRGAAADLPNEMRTTPMAYDGQTPESQFAVYRGEPMQSQTAGLRGAPPMEQTLAQYQVGQQVKGRNPNISPAPAETPQQAGDRARNIRQTPAEAAAITAAIENTKVDIQTKARLAEETRTKTRGRKLFSAALNDMRKDYNTLNKLQAIPSTGRPALDNFGDYLSSSYLGRKAQSAVGTKASVALNNIANSRLTLLNALKEVTNMSATQLSSNIELMTFLDSLADPTQGYESAMETIRRLENLYGAPAAAQGNRKTPVVASGWGKVEVEPN